MNEPEVLVRKEGTIAIVTLNRPERLNALIPELNQLLTKTVAELSEDREVNVLILTGAGKAFCSGADVSGWKDGANPTEQNVDEKRKPAAAPTTELILPFREFPRPVIGAINGLAAGAGFALAMACDIRIASDQAKFGSLFIKRGLTPASGLSWLLPRLVGAGKALEIMWTGDWVTAKEAENLGLVNRVVSNEEVLTTAIEVANHISANPPIALELTKRLVFQGLDLPMRAHLELETHYQKYLFGTEDFNEATQSFIEKRPPMWKGR